jgi:hypothetical protein
MSSVMNKTWWIHLSMYL